MWTYLGDWGMEIWHLSTQHVTKLAQYFLVPGVILQTDLGLNLKLNTVYSIQPLMWPPLQPGPSSHIRGMASHQRGIYTKREDLVPDSGSLVTGGITQQKGHITGGDCHIWTEHEGYIYNTGHGAKMKGWARDQGAQTKGLTLPKWMLIGPNSLLISDVSKVFLDFLQWYKNSILYYQTLKQSE